MIKIVNYRVGISPKSFIQKLIDMVGIKNGQIVIKVQKGEFVHLQLHPSYKPNELESTESEET